MFSKRSPVADRCIKIRGKMYVQSCGREISRGKESLSFPERAVTARLAAATSRGLPQRHRSAQRRGYLHFPAVPQSERLIKPQHKEERSREWSPTTGRDYLYDPLPRNQFRIIRYIPTASNGTPPSLPEGYREKRSRYTPDVLITSFLCRERRCARIRTFRDRSASIRERALAVLRHGASGRLFPSPRARARGEGKKSSEDKLSRVDPAAISASVAQSNAPRAPRVICRRDKSIPIAIAKRTPWFRYHATAAMQREVICRRARARVPLERNFRPCSRRAKVVAARRGAARERTDDIIVREESSARTAKTYVCQRLS